MIPSVNKKQNHFPFGSFYLLIKLAGFCFTFHFYILFLWDILKQIPYEDCKIDNL